MRFESRKKDYTKLLNAVLKDYKKISEAPDDLNDKNLYKSVDDQSGQVYLITNPRSWSYRIGDYGKFYFNRPPPRDMGNITDLMKSREMKNEPLMVDDGQSWSEF